MSEFWTPIYIERVTQMIENVFWRPQRSSALAIFFEILRRTDRTSMNGYFGTCRLGREELAECCNSTIQTVRTVLKNLEKDGIITIAATKRGTVVTVRHLGRYIYLGDAGNHDAHQQATSRQPTAHQQSTSQQPLSRRERSKERDTSACAPPERPASEPQKPAAPRWQADAVFVRWNDLHADFPAMLRHEELTEDRERAILQALRTYGGADIVLQAVENYAQVLDGAEYRWEHAYTIEDFMRKGISRFLAEARPLENFLVRSEDAPAAAKREHELRELQEARERLRARIEELRPEVQAGNAPPGDLSLKQNELARVDARLARLKGG